MDDRKRDEHSDPQRAGQSREQGRGARNWRDMRSYVDELIDEARQRGDFDNLRGKGRPLNLGKNVYEGDRAIAYSLLRNNQMAPPEIERSREIDAELARAESLLDRLRRQRDRMRPGALPSERRAHNVLRDGTATRYAEALRSINSHILSLNIVAPPALHRRRIDLEARMRVFAEEFPRLKE